MIPSIDIIIVNRNSGELLRECISSIVSAGKNSFILSKICIVDDLSTDNSLENIRNIKLPIHIIKNSVRSGYGASCNSGARECKGDYLLFLNTDVILKNDSIAIPIQFFEKSENENVAILGIQQHDKSGNIQRNCSRFPTASTFLFKTFGLNKIIPSIFPGAMMVEWDHLKTRQVDQIMGSVMFMRRSIFDKLGGYDERFFVYYEDLDLSLRTKNLGFKSIFLGNVSAYHIEGYTAHKVWKESVFLNLRSRIIYAYKHYYFFPALIVTLTSLIIEPIIRILWSILRLSIKDAVIYTQSAVILWMNFPFVVLKRPRINWPLR